MLPWINLAIALICFLGFFIGRFIASKTEEEVKVAKKYFIWAMKFIPLLILLFILIFEFDFILVMLIAIVLSLIIKNYYLFLGASFLVSDANLFLLNSVLVFLYLLFDGSLNIKLDKKELSIKFILFILPVLGGIVNALFDWNWLRR